MTTQGVLFLAGVILLIVAAICAAFAAWLFVKRDIRGIRDDLTGKKRAKIIAEMDELTPTNRRRQRRGVEPKSAAAEAAASAARHAAKATDLEELQVTAAPKPKEKDAQEETPSQRAVTSAASEAPATVVGGESEETLVNTVVGTGDIDESTTVDGLELSTAPGGAALPKGGIASIQVVRKIVLAESNDFIRIGRQGEADA